MAKALVLLVLLGYVEVLNCQKQHPIDDEFERHITENGNPRYSYGYGVSDASTGDIKNVWEEKEGDTVKGHYSVLEPDGSMRTVEYSAGPNSGFSAVVNNDGVQPHLEVRQNVMEEKALRDQERFYDFSDDADMEPYSTNDKKRKKHPFDSLFKDYSANKKRPKYPIDLEPSEYTHSISIKHPRDDYDSTGEAQSHQGYSSDPNCKTKHKKENHNVYGNLADFDFRKQKYPSYDSDTYRETFDKYFDPSIIDIAKHIQMYKYNEQYNRPPKQDELAALPTSVKYSYPVPPDAPPDNIYPEDMPLRPKKKTRPHKKPEPYPAEDLDDYILVPKKKYKKPPRPVEPFDYQQDMDDEYDHPSGFDDGYEDDRNHKPPRGTGPKEVVRKIVKKRKPIVNLLDIFDI